MPSPDAKFSSLAPDKEIWRLSVVAALKEKSFRHSRFPTINQKNFLTTSHFAFGPSYTAVAHVLTTGTALTLGMTVLARPGALGASTYGLRLRTGRSRGSVPPRCHGPFHVGRGLSLVSRVSPLPFFCSDAVVIVPNGISPTEKLSCYHRLLLRCWKLWHS